MQQHHQNENQVPKIPNSIPLILLLLRTPRQTPSPTLLPCSADTSPPTHPSSPSAGLLPQPSSVAALFFVLLQRQNTHVFLARTSPGCLCSALAGHSTSLLLCRPFDVAVGPPLSSVQCRRIQPPSPSIHWVCSSD